MLVRMFEEHPDRLPYKVCPDCGGSLKVFPLFRRPAETVLYCPKCSWNDSMTDMTAVIGEPLHGPGSSTYLQGDFLVTFTRDGRTLVENMSEHASISESPHR